MEPSTPAALLLLTDSPLALSSGASPSELHILELCLCAPWRCPWRPGSPALKTAALNGSGPDLGSMCWANSCVEAPPESPILFLPAPARPGCSNSAPSREGPSHRLPRSRICHPVTGGVEDMPLHYAPLGHPDYFELQALEKQQMQGEGVSPEGAQSSQIPSWGFHRPGNSGSCHRIGGWKSPHPDKLCHKRSDPPPFLLTAQSASLKTIYSLLEAYDPPNPIFPIKMVLELKF